MRFLLKFILKILSKATIRKYKPVVIGITGSVGKTSAKEAVFEVLESQRKARRTVGNFNSEVGVPLAILGDWSEEELVYFSLEAPEDSYILAKVIFLIKLFAASVLRLIWPDKNYPEILVLEMAADRPRDIQYLVNIARPKVGVVTAIGEIPVHIEFYSGPDAVAKEKANLIKALPSEGLAVLNFDDHVVYEMNEMARSRTLTFGFGDGADVRASDLSYFVDRESGDEENKDIYSGLSFKVNYADRVVPFRLNNALGRHQVYAALSACCVGLYLGMNLVEIAQALENIRFPKHRMKLLTGTKNTLIIDDTYNASPLSTHAALDTLREFGDKVIAKRGKGRKVAVLGDMSELGKYTMNAHRNIGNLAAGSCDLLITVGHKAKLIADSAQNQMSLDKIISYEHPEELSKEIYNKIEEGDIILIKGSRLLELEKIVYSIGKV